MKVSIVTFCKYHGRRRGEIGSSVIRGDWLAEAWPEAKLWSNGQYFDAIIFQKAYWKDMMQDFEGVKILDLCDPDWMQGDVNIKEISDLCDAITCSTEELTKFMKNFIHDKKILTVPDRLNLDYFTRKRAHTEKARSVVWFGYYHNAKAVLPHILPSLKTRKLNLYVVSNSPFEPNNNFGVEIINIPWSVENAFMDIQSGDFAINPQPPVSNFRFKSNNKTLISWGLGLPVANSADDMDRFLDPKERQKEADMRWEEIKISWDIKLNVNLYKELICHLQENKEKR